MGNINLYFSGFYSLQIKSSYPQALATFLKNKNQTKKKKATQ